MVAVAKTVVQAAHGQHHPFKETTAAIQMAALLLVLVVVVVLLPLVV